MTGDLTTFLISVVNDFAFELTEASGRVLQLWLEFLPHLLHEERVASLNRNSSVAVRSGELAVLCPILGTRIIESLLSGLSNFQSKRIERVGETFFPRFRV